MRLGFRLSGLGLPLGGGFSFQPLLLGFFRSRPLPFGYLLWRRLIGRANDHKGHKADKQRDTGHHGNGLFRFFLNSPDNQQNHSDSKRNQRRKKQEAKKTYHAEHPPAKDADTTTATSVPPRGPDGPRVTVTQPPMRESP